MKPAHRDRTPTPRAAEGAPQGENPVLPAFPVVAVGASAGGLQAFRKLLECLPADTRMAFILVPHLDPTHQSLMSELLSRVTKIPVQEVEPGMRVEPNHAYVISPNTIMTISQDRLKLVPRDAGHGVKHECINHFMISLAQEYRERAIGVILSGTASDGSAGIKSIKFEGGVTFAQDDSAEFNEMPRNAIATGSVDFVLPPEGIARELVRISRHPHLAPLPVVIQGAPAEGILGKIFLLLKDATGVDFANYKRPTLERRIVRRMAIGKIEKLSDYARHLENNPLEVQTLHDDLLISVTSFFREPESFEALKTGVFPALIRDRVANDPIRVWVPGCSSGEEAYSIAIALVEFMTEQRIRFEIQIFGTDISEIAIEKARAGVYESGIVDEVSAERLKRFFVRVNGAGYQISHAIRDLCVFARQDLTRDPPFSKLDLLSCRNMLIYLGGSLQKRVIPWFHYALKQTGFLMLGPAESVERYTSLFVPIDKTHSIYSKVPGSQVDRHQFVNRDAYPKQHLGPVQKEKKDEDLKFDAGKAADRLLLTQYVPAGIVVDDKGLVAEVRGETGPYLRLASGKPSSNMLKMVREELVLDLDDVVQEARKSGTRALRERVRYKFEERTREVDIEVVPIPETGDARRYFLVLFKENLPRRPSAPGKPLKKRGRAAAEEEARNREIVRLRAQLVSAQERQQAVVEQLEAANEELHSVNEELQSSNEELETSTEELQSSNEELTTLNEEMNRKNLDLGLLNNDLTNVISSVNIPLAIVDSKLRLRRFTPQAEKLFNVVAGDLGRRITDFNSFVQVPNLERVLLTVLETLVPAEQEVKDAEDRWYSMRVRPYRTVEGRIEGAVIAFVEIDALKRTIADSEEGRAYTEAILDTVPNPFLVLDESLRVKAANQAFYETFRVGKEEILDVSLSDPGNSQWNIVQLRDLLSETALEGIWFRGVEIEHRFERVGRKIMLFHARRIVFRHDRPQKILLAIEDVTEFKNASAAQLLLASIVESSQDAVITETPDRVISSWNKGAAAMYGYAAGEALGRPISILIPPDRLEEDKGISEKVRRGERIPTFDTTRIRKDGSSIDVALTISPLVDSSGKVLGVSKIVRDITDRRRAEKEIMSVKEGLERRVLERTAELEEAFKHLDAFTHTVSHDLRAPLRTMNSFSQILIEDYSGKVLDETAQSYVQRIADAASRMDKLVLDLLRYSRLTREEIPIERVETQEVLTEILKGMESEIKKRKAEVTVEASLPAVLGHRAMLDQALTNLIANAMNFMAPGVTPRVRVRGEIRENRVRLWVEDNGIGIAREHHARIFGIFERLHTQDVYPGTGIGLSIAQKAMERMGGKIGLESEPGKGSRFWIELPKG